MRLGQPPLGEDALSVTDFGWVGFWEVGGMGIWWGCICVLGVFCLWKKTTELGFDIFLIKYRTHKRSY